MLRVADYPGYQNVYELNNKESLNIKYPYRLFTTQNKIGSKITIPETLEVNEFDESM